MQGLCLPDTLPAGLEEELRALRHELHRHPELGFREHKTAGLVAAFMERLGLDVATGVGGTGVVGLLRGGADGPTVGVRACLDALPIEERTYLPYASCKKGVMHACGHDGNMVMALGAAAVWSERRSALRGNLKLIFQPSEEETGGAAAMMRAGVLKRPDVDAVLTLHNWHGLEQGKVVVKDGPVLASSDVFRITVKGSAGHGAWPHLAVDPVVAAADLICRLQHIVSREIDPLVPAALSIGKIRGGTAVNIIPEQVVLEGTVRVYDATVREFIQRRMEEIAEGVAAAARAECVVDFGRLMPPAVNPAGPARRVRAALEAALPPGTVTDTFSAGMGCEEFSLFQERIPGLFLFIGNDRAGKPAVPLHAPDYDFNDALIVPGVRALCAAALACWAGD